MASTDPSPETETAGVDGDALDRDFFASLVEHGSDAIVTIDADSEIVFANAAVERVFGYESAALVGEPLTTIMPERFHDTHLGAVATYLETGERSLDWTDIQLPARHADGHEIQLDITFEEHVYEGRRLFSGIMRDVTDRVERKRELERQNERLERFAGIVSHDLRDPIQRATAAAALALEAGDESVEPYLADVEEALEEMDALVADVLELARQGRAVDDPEPVALGAVAEAAWEGTVTGGASLEIGSLPETEADPDRLRELFVNLFRNSVQHTDGPVTVRVTGETDPPSFAVADDGDGFDADPERLFERGYTTSDSGTGLGLSIVDTVAAAHGWEVTAGASADGGARFRFEIGRGPA